ncbi:MAG: PAS domain S-box protein [Desulfobacteraceae bacterium]|jgi:PAS domain S-box-containing protein
MYEKPTYEELEERILNLEREYAGLKNAEKNWEFYFNASVDLLCIIGFDLKFKQINPSWETILGWTRNDLEGKLYTDFVHPEDIEATADLTGEKSKERNEPATQFENRYRCKDGSYRRLYWSAMPHRNNRHTFAIARDITERKQVEETLRSNEVFLETLINSIPAPVFYKDRDGNYLGFNDAYEDFFGKTRDDLIGKSVFHMATPELAKVHHGIDQELFQKGGIRRYESQVENAQGDIRDVIFTKSVFNDLNGNITGLIGTLFDITEKKKMANEIIQSHKMEALGALAGGIAHDFNNILSSIIGFTELSLDDAKTGTLLEENLRELYSAGQRAKNLVWQILTFARQTDEERKPIQVGTITKEVLKFIRSTIPTSIEIKPNIGSDSLVMGNSTQIHQIIMNICTNAAHAMDETGGILEVGLKDVKINKASKLFKKGLNTGNYLEIRVSDTGGGIPPNVIDSIFEPYFTTKAQGEGTGMGLSVVQGIVESCNGKITVESKPGDGTTFRVYLPITKKQGIQQAYDYEQLPSGTEHILFVDDEAPIANIGRQALERLGYQVTTRTSSVEALKLFQAKPDAFDLVVTDFTMPNMTGDLLTTELMAIRPDIPVILCTGYSNKLSEDRAMEIGIRAFLYKPIVKAKISKTIRKVLDEDRAAAAL